MFKILGGKATAAAAEAAGTPATPAAPKPSSTN
jgi:hypothetical protein